MGAEPLENLEAIEPGQVVVQNDEVWRGLTDQVIQRLRPITANGDVTRDARLGDRSEREQFVLGIVLNEEDLSRLGQMDHS